MAIQRLRLMCMGTLRKELDVLEWPERVLALATHFYKLEIVSAWMMERKAAPAMSSWQMNTAHAIHELYPPHCKHA